MILPAIGISFGQHQASQQQGVQPLKNNVQGLSQSLKAGGLAAAQKSFAAVQQDLQAVQSAQQSSQAITSTDSTKAISTDIQGLSQSLKSGDLTGAQKALASLQQDLQSPQASQGHHHHHAVSASQAASMYAKNGANPSGTANLINHDISSQLSAGSGVNVSA